MLNALALSELLHVTLWLSSSSFVSPTYFPQSQSTSSQLSDNLFLGDALETFICLAVLQCVCIFAASRTVWLVVPSIAISHPPTLFSFLASSRGVRQCFFANIRQANSCLRWEWGTFHTVPFYSAFWEIPTFPHCPCSAFQGDRAVLCAKIGRVSMWVEGGNTSGDYKLYSSSREASSRKGGGREEAKPPFSLHFPSQWRKARRGLEP